MYIIQKTPNQSGGYSALQPWKSNIAPNGYYLCPDVFYEIFYSAGKQCAGFVNIVADEETNTVTSMVWDDATYQAFLETLVVPVETAKESKLKEIADTCEATIYAGMDVTLSSGDIKHFSYTANDQANVSEMFTALAGGATEFPYHADDESCEVYSAKDIVIIYSNLSMMKTSQITYQNQLKQYVKTLTTTKEVEAVVYGQDLTGEYLETYNNLVAIAKEQMEKVIGGMTNANANTTGGAE